MLKTGLKVLTDVHKILEKERQRTLKAASTSVRVEAFRLKKTGAMLLRRGQLGLVPLSKLKEKRGKGKAPLKSFAKGFIYKVDSQSLSARVGFVGDTAGTQWQQRILEKSIPGYRWLYPPEKVEKLHKAGIHLRKGTTSALVPGRDIIEAVLEHEGENKISQNIMRNFDAKMRGERI